MINLLDCSINKNNNNVNSFSKYSLLVRLYSVEYEFLLIEYLFLKSLEL